MIRSPSRRGVASLWALVMGGGGLAFAASSPAPRAEPPRFLIYKLQYPLGDETVQIDSTGATIITTSERRFRYLGSQVALTSTLTMARNGEAAGLDVRGRTSTLTSEELKVTIGDSTIAVSHHRADTSLRRPTRFFPIGAYPAAMLKEALFRYWQRQGRPARLPIVPAGDVTFALRGRDTLAVGSRSEIVSRYAIGGIVWGQQVAWFADDGRLIATVFGDAELDRMEEVRAGYEANLPLFVRQAVRDGLADMAATAAAARPVHQGDYAIRGARLIDGTGGAPLDDATIVIQGGRIAQVGARSAITIPRGLPVVEAQGKTIIPGLWDMHAHFEQFEWPAAQLAAGVTTARDVGNELEVVTAMRDAIAAGRGAGPRMLLAGVIDGGSSPLGVHLAATPDEARAVVRRYHDAGFQQIKIYQSLPPALVPVVTDEAHRLGMTVTGHVPRGMNALEFVQAGADQINHLNFVVGVMVPPPVQGQPRPPFDIASPEAQRALAIFRERKTVVDPSLARGEMGSHPRDSAFSRYEPGLLKAPAPLVEILNATGSAGAPAAIQARLDQTLATVAALQKAGIPIVLGTDLVVPGHSMHRELELAVRGGMTPMEALQAATIVPARAMRQEHEAGTIERGKRADMVVLDGDPLAAIANIRKVAGVIQGGRWLNPADLWRGAGFQP